ncbi:MAG: hypothetical protein RL068_918, partial [Actinomycetota bacterium]
MMPSIDAMTLFNSSTPRRKLGGWAISALLLMSLGSLVLLPSGYVIERPGQVFNVMGEINGTQVISSSDAEIFESQTQLDITTVSLLGNRESNPGWLQVLWAWADPEQIVLPLDEVYPPNLSTEQVRAESSAQMEVSQQDAIAAALSELGYSFTRELYVASVIEETPAAGKLVAGDFIQSVGGTAVATFEELRSEIQVSEGNEIAVVVVRDGQELTVKITPEMKDQSWVIGAMVGYTYDFPVDIDLQLGDVGGPSGGLIFALGIIDSLTLGSMASDTHIAGTGTISADGLVGPIGGIELKMIAAAKAGATLFLAPEANCSEVIGQIPEGLDVVSVGDLKSAISAIEDYQS